MIYEAFASWFALSSTTSTRIVTSTKAHPLVIMDAVPQSFPVDGHTTPMTPGQTFDYRVPDIYGRPVGADLGALP